MEHSFSMNTTKWLVASFYRLEEKSVISLHLIRTYMYMSHAINKALLSKPRNNYWSFKTWRQQRIWNLISYNCLKKSVRVQINTLKVMFSTLKKEAERSSQRWILLYKATLLHIAKARSVSSHDCGNCRVITLLSSSKSPCLTVWLLWHRVRSMSSLRLSQ